MSDDGTDSDMLPASSASGAASTSRAAVAADAIGGNSTHRLQFFIGEHPLPYDMTVYQAVQQFGGGNVYDVSDSDSSVDNRAAAASTSIYGTPGIWARIHTIYYRPAEDTSNAASPFAASSSSKASKSESGRKGKGASSKQSKRKSSSPADDLWAEGNAPERQSPLIPFLVDTLPRCFAGSGNNSDPSADVLCLLRVLHALNRYWGSLYPVTYYRPVVPASDFANAKLTAKVNRQLQDPIIIMTSNLPPWLKEVALVCPFLFPFETRQLLFYVTSFDRDRALLRLLDSAPELGAADGAGGQERVTPDLERKKRVIARENLLKQAEQVSN